MSRTVQLTDTDGTRIWLTMAVYTPIQGLNSLK